MCGFPKFGVPLWDPNKKDYYSILESTLGCPYSTYGNCNVMKAVKTLPRPYEALRASAFAGSPCVEGPVARQQWQGCSEAATLSFPVNFSGSLVLPSK